MRKVGINKADIKKRAVKKANLPATKPARQKPKTGENAEAPDKGAEAPEQNAPDGETE